MPASETTPPFIGFSRAKAFAAARERLRQAGVEAADEDARLLLLDACAIDRLALVTNGGTLLSPNEAAGFEMRLARRTAGEPASRILGRRPFWTLEIEVRPDVLDPRADSEAVIRLALRLLHADRAAPRSILDLGCGSGALLCALLDEFPEAYGVGVDLSPTACAATRANILACGFAGRAAVVQARWGEALGGSFDLVVSNPPYIPTDDIAGLDHAVRDYDPHLALDGGADGLGAYRDLFCASQRLLGARGLLVVEFGAGQEEDVAGLAEGASLRKVDVEADLSGQKRASAFVTAG
ncbi:MAG: peptide chain release factor N(5)-glutamine methyltransferase [Rhodoblastus sp.]